MTTLWILVLAVGGISLQGSNAQQSYQSCSPVDYLFRDPNNCNLYWSCTTFGLVQMFCPAYLAFRVETQQCDYPWKVPECQDINECSLGTPCQRGVCKNLQVGFYCDCQDTGYTGDLCQLPLPTRFCISNQACVNGRCQNEGGTNVCQCDPGFTGQLCEKNNFCDPSPCNYGRCETFTDGFSCDCRGTGYTGVFCDLPVTENSTCVTQNPCIRGQCVALASGPFCNCQGTGFTGQTCDQRVTGDPCYTGACTNGVCVNRNGSATCDCTGTLYTGPRCDMTACNFQGSNPCMNGGTCQAQPRETYTCVCPSGLGGENCETLIVPDGCPVYQCPDDVPGYNYSDWNDRNCGSYYSCQNGNLQQRSCPARQMFDMITMTCRPLFDQLAVFCTSLWI